MSAKRVPTALKTCQKNQRAPWKQTRITPVDRRAFDPANETLHYIPSEEGQLWKKITYKLLSASNGAAEVADAHSAHVIPRRGDEIAPVRRARTSNNQSPGQCDLHKGALQSGIDEA
ncbi:hypothetical protein WOLCODRAFT_153486 [Wolfiporia cocos MD-104 SS10]|uniref:Uncharacterized protein n=1 Tax=Wolfiporia cocos (strain MD-104) TaxID=742152 RepID=A0A2H3JMM1_WOLCO|nr:hypothetical protein WOLCODRAFT_153486 [Wolfiporia cocos MD-104 SS10]